VIQKNEVRDQREKNAEQGIKIRRILALKIEGAERVLTITFPRISLQHP
jgi:hypothetical protein